MATSGRQEQSAANGQAAGRAKRSGRRWVNPALWAAAAAITLASAVFQRTTGPTYPLPVSLTLDGQTVSGTLPRTHPGAGGQTVQLTAPDPAFSGELVFRRYRSHDDWSAVPLVRDGAALAAEIPHQPPAGKVQYRLRLSRGGQVWEIPASAAEPVIIRFRGAVPGWILTVHIVAIFFAMLVSVRAGLQALRRGAPLMRLTWWTLGLLVVGGLLFGPLVQKYAFGAYWTGWPVGDDLTDTKTLVATLFWVAAAIAGRRGRQPRWFVLAAALAVFVIFMIPHSLRGSELDYTQIQGP